MLTIGGVNFCKTAARQLIGVSLTECHANESSGMSITFTRILITFNFQMFLVCYFITKSYNINLATGTPYKAGIYVHYTNKF